MEIILIFSFFIQLMKFDKFYIVENMTKCIHNNQKIKLQNTEVTTTEFSVSLWVRATYYHNETSKPFLKFKNINSNKEIILTSTKNISSDKYTIKYLSNNLGEINHSNTALNTFEEQDFINLQNFYINWNYIAISFLKSSGTKIITYIQTNISSEFSISNNHEISDLMLFPCLSINMESLGGLYFSEITVYNQKSNTNTLFNNLKKMNSKIWAIYLFNENSRKNSLFIPNQIKNEIGPLMVISNSPEYPFRQNRDTYSLMMFQKLFKFDLDNLGVRDNSYLIACKLKVTKVEGQNFKFLFYGRADKNLDILNNNPDKIDINLTFKNRILILFGYIEYDIKYYTNGSLAKSYSSNFSGTININLVIKIKHQIGNSYPYAKEHVTFLSWYENATLLDFWYEDSDFTNFSKDDQHYFGNPSTIKTDLAFFDILEYSITKGFGKNYHHEFKIDDTYCIKFDVYNQRRFNEFDTENLILDSSLNYFSGYCGNNCAKCDSSHNCLSCFNRDILNSTFKCLTPCSFDNNYDSYLSKCETNMDVIVISFTSGNISSTSLKAIRTNLFDRKTNESLEFLIIIRLFVDMDASNTENFEITFVTSIDTDLDQNSFNTYFNNHPSSEIYSLTWSFYYKVIDPLDYQNVKIYGRCFNPGEYFLPTVNNQGICVSNCGIGYYINSYNICKKCSSNCDVCNSLGCQSCKNNYELILTVCISKMLQCIINDSFCSDCDSLNENFCVSCLTNYTLFSGTCLHNTNCLIFDSNCNNCDPLDTTMCNSCLSNYTLFSGTCISNTNCLMVDSNCDSCDNLDQTICATCTTNFSIKNNLCLHNSNCLIVDLNCSTCDPLDLTTCITCEINYTLHNEICLHNSNCLIVDNNCSTCDILDKTICVNCLTNYHLLNENCLHTSNCLVVVDNCSTCDPLNSTDCIDCDINFSLFEGNCIDSSSCRVNIKDCLKCDLFDIKICEKCKTKYFYDKNLVKCSELICQKNCLECYLDLNNEKNCSKCENNFSLFNFECVKDICFSTFCQDCSENLKSGCDLCYNCINLKFIEGIVLNCEETFLNCKSCIFKLNSELQCLKCNDFTIYVKEKNKCTIITKIEFEDSIITYLDKDFYLKECKKGYFYQNLENLCYKLRLDCNFGCKKCYGKDKICTLCNEKFNLENNSCNYINSKSKIEEDSTEFNEILKYFYYSESSCKNIINNITLIIENNITTYLDENNYVNAKTFEVKEFYIKCSENRLKCSEYKKKQLEFLKLGLVNCPKIYNENHIAIINKTRNITLNENLNFCKEEEIKTDYKEKIECENIECINFIKKKEFKNFTNIIKCKNNFNNNLKENIVEKFKDITEINNCEFCQKGLKYFCQWKEDCRKVCQFELKNNSEHPYLINIFDKGKINISNELLNLKISNDIIIEYDYISQKIIFKFLKNISNYIFNLKPSYIISSQNCILKSEKKFIIKNYNYIGNSEFFKQIKPSQNPISSVVVTAVSLGFFNFIPLSFFEILQFNDLFSYFGYLNIDGGSFFNFIFSLQRNDFDLDKSFVDERKNFEYLMILKKVKNLITISLMDYYLIFGIIFTFFFKIYLNRTKYSRYLKICKYYQKFRKKKKNYKKFNLFQKLVYKIQLQYILFDPFILLSFYEKMIFFQYIFRLPHYVKLFVYKYHLIDKKYFIPFYFIFLIISLFLLKMFIRMIQYLNINSISLYKSVMIVDDKKLNWYLVFYQTVFLSLNIITIFLICFLRMIPQICFVFVIILIFTENILIFSFAKRKLILYIIMNFFTTSFFLFWIILVCLKKFFLIDFPVGKNFFYCLANISKLISNFILSKILKKIKKNKVFVEDN